LSDSGRTASAHLHVNHAFNHRPPIHPYYAPRDTQQRHTVRKRYYSSVLCARLLLSPTPSFGTPVVGYLRKPPTVPRGQHFSASRSRMPPARKVSSVFIKGITTSTASCQTFQNYQSQYHEPQALSAQIQSNHIYPITTSLGVWCWGPEVFLSNSTTTPHPHRWRRRPSSSSL
jgi:hypothetical protein